MLMNQMPSLGDIRSAEPRDVRLRIQAIRALLDFKETKSVEIRQGYAEKLRKVTSERD